jgi:hypothetical protein
LDLALGLVTVAVVAQPVPADFKQLRNVIAQRSFKMSQRRGKSHPKVLR